jgi:hypothetical protein
MLRPSAAVTRTRRLCTRSSVELIELCYGYAQRRHVLPDPWHVPMKAKKDKHEKAWKDFAAWCEARGLRALPAHPWTVAAYARWCEARHRFPVVAKQIRVIARVHLLACAGAPDRHPTVTRTLRALEARSLTRPHRAALFPTVDVAEGAPASGAPKSRARRKRGRGRALPNIPQLVTRRPLA